ncbi:MAG: efflux RND transporter periplasmic adaptor subunit [Sedimentisphaerales bacterium]|nr:efflux RND transporter periplasmic adaptor subunit [Sedimentisphaerales bacterium]
MKHSKWILILILCIGAGVFTVSKILPHYGIEWHSEEDTYDHDHISGIEEQDFTHDTLEGVNSEEGIVLTQDEIQQMGIKTAIAGPGQIQVEAVLSGQIGLNRDQMAHIVPRVSGVVHEVFVTEGDQVRQGQILALIESRDLADAKAAYLAAVEKKKLDEAAFVREKELFEKKVTSEQEYLAAQQALAETRIQVLTASQKLYALGFSSVELQEISRQSPKSFIRYSIVAPFDGTIIQKHIVLGEVVDDKSDVFIIANLDSLWVDLHVYQNDLETIRPGQKVVISPGSNLPDAEGIITRVLPLIESETRTSVARILLDNSNGTFRPGLYVTARVQSTIIEATVRVLSEAVQMYEGRSVVFVKDEHGFEPVEIRAGRSDRDYIEVISGLESGMEYVSKGSFQLKAKILTGTLNNHAGHGH